MADPNPQDIRSVLSELRDTNKDKRRAAVMKLGMIGGDDAIKALIRTVENDYEDLIVRGRAALMLGKLGDTRAVAPLIRALDAPGFQTPLNAVQSLGRLGDVRAIEPLIQIVETQTDRLREAAIDSLARLGYAFSEASTSEPEPER